MTKLKDRQKNILSFGFTLIELLVVISILSFLASVILSATNSARIKARDSHRLSQIRQVVNALELYYDKHGNYPNRVPSSDMDIPQQWTNMISDLDGDGFISASFAINNKNDSFRLIKTTYASLGPVVVFVKCSIQDPLYDEAGDYLISYGYSAINNGADYNIRIRLEDPNNPALDFSPSGSFVGINTSGTNACDKSLGYYCTTKMP